MAFTPVNELERLLVAAATDPAARPAFYRGIVQHELFLMTEGMKPEREQSIVTDENRSLRICMIELDGKLYAPIFSSVERTSTLVAKEAGCVAMKGDVLLAMLRGKDLVMNPGAEYGKIFTASEVEWIPNGSIFGHRATYDVGGKKTLLVQPRDYPRHITDALSRYFARSRDVKAAYLAQAFIPAIDQAPHTQIGVEVVGNWQKVVEEAGLVVREVAKAGEIVDIVLLGANATDTIGNYMKRQTTPFYVRKKWLGLF